MSQRFDQVLRSIDLSPDLNGYSFDRTRLFLLVGLAGALGVGKGARSMLPAHRASRVDPMRALKYE
jgi:hypothetical protein